MRIRIDEDTYEGSPADIIDDLREQSFHKDDFPNTKSFLCHMRNNFTRLTDMPCELPEGSADIRAKAMLERLAEIDALEILESD